jgi:transcriptional regulator with XRE-family HTH domain
MIDMQLSGALTGSRDTVQPVDPTRRLPPTRKIDAHVGSRLRARRIQLGLSQAALGRYLGITFSQVQKYEKGSNRIGAGRLYHLAALLGVSVHYLFEGLDDTRPDPADKSEASPPSDAARLQEAFARISDPQARQALLSLASSMAEGH